MMTGIRRLIGAEPYRLLFMLGALCAFVGVGQWIFFYIGVISEYPIKVHSQLMILGFLFSFVSGFLMTALPRMTGTSSATRLEKITINGALLTFLILSLLGLYKIAQGVSVALFIFLIIYFVRRKLKMKSRPLPTGFVFVPLGLLSGLSGVVLVLLSDDGLFNMLSLGKLILYEGFILNLIIGLGSRLIPFLTKKVVAPSPIEINEVTNRLFLFEAIFFNASFFLEAFWSVSAGIAIRFCVMGFVVYKNFKIFRPMVERTKLGIGIITASAALPICYFLILLFPLQRANLIHFLYIAGFATLTLLVSVRVSLAHGGASLDLERTAHSILVLVGAFLTAATIRVMGPLLGGDSFLRLYAYAGGFFLFGLLSLLYFLRNCLIAGSDEVEKC